MYKIVVKPFFDKLMGLILLLISLPILLIVSMLLKLSQGSVFFVQERPGYKAQPFKLIKFKTMNDATDQQGNLLPDDARLTKVGSFVRKTSLDELPQLINIIKGDMSFIGPRPLLMEYLPLYSKEQYKRHLVKPGISGWAQVNGRNSISWEEKFNYDIEYVQRQSFFFDLKILLLTVYKVLKAEGISGEGTATMKKFEGTK